MSGFAPVPLELWCSHQGAAITPSTMRLRDNDVYVSSNLRLHRRARS